MSFVQTDELFELDEFCVNRWTFSTRWVFALDELFELDEFWQTYEVFRTAEFLNFLKHFPNLQNFVFYITIQIFREVKMIKNLEVLNFSKYFSLIWIYQKSYFYNTLEWYQKYFNFGTFPILGVSGYQKYATGDGELYWIMVM